jgi:hypothetical protein
VRSEKVQVKNDTSSNVHGLTGHRSPVTHHSFDGPHYCTAKMGRLARLLQHG